MATLIITRRLYLMTRLQTVELPSQSERRKNLAIEWILGLVIPVLVAGPLYYIVQALRFRVDEGLGCTDAPDGSILSILLINSWSVIPPLISVTIYYPRAAWTFYRQSREINHFLQTNSAISRTNYFRILALASIDILLTLPVGITLITLNAVQSASFGDFPFYYGWTVDHTDWQPKAYSYAELLALGTSTVAQKYFNQWTSPVLAFVIFGLFGVTAEACASYGRVICAIVNWIGWKIADRERKGASPPGDIEQWGGQPQNVSFNRSIGSHPSFINSGARELDQTEGNGKRATRELESCAGSEDIEDSGIRRAPVRARNTHESYDKQVLDASAAM